MPEDNPAADFNTESTPQSAPVEPVSWTASEFIAHDKSVGWYLMLSLVAAVIAAAIYLITRDFISVAVVVVAAILFGVYGARQPRQLQYVADHNGVKVGDKFFAYQAFRSFSIVPEGAFSSIVFMPLKRFSPPLSIYYAPEHEAQIIELLSSELPLEEPRHDAVDSLMRRIRF